ncbi:MAG TPA: hypothetical protein VGW35_10290 [Methylomirabilota bacterium]|jgi:hypothetical protein|nr:hypothetical protein [Methylomirabilota bacterium]
MSLGEPNIKRALSWVLDRLADDPTAKRSKLIDDASRQFDLTPLEADFLYRQLQEAEKDRPTSSG